MAVIECSIQYFTYRNQDSGWGVAKAVSDRKPFTLVGAIAECHPGRLISAEGQWKNDKRYGKQFDATFWNEIMTTDIRGLKEYLSSGIISGIGPSRAAAIVDKFGVKTIEIIENTPEKLLEIPGIGQKKIEAISNGWSRQRALNNLMLFLHGFGVSAATAKKIYNKYGKDTIQRIKDNPYCIADDISGIGFLTADRIASNMGIGKNDPRRCRSAIKYSLVQLSGDGHVFCEKEKLIEATRKYVDIETLSDTVVQMVADGSLSNDNDRIYLPAFYHAEIATARRLRAIMDTPVTSLSERSGRDSSGKSDGGIKYDEVQALAIQTALKSRIMILTGGPGTGKTTTTKGIIDAFQVRGMEVLLAAPTGRAARRLSETTGMEACTIHRLLEYNPSEGFIRDTDNPLDGDVVIIDESSMIDLMLFYRLVNALPLFIRLILVGDVNQLPSVGAGNVLHDIIESGSVPVVRLTRIFRQAQTSRIVMNAHAVNAGVMPDISNGRTTDFFFVKTDTPESIAEVIVDLVKRRLPATYKVSSRDIQVLSPMQRGTSGTNNLNTLIQEAINSDNNGITFGANSFRVGDKVMQTRNNYDKNVFNGDIGIVESVDCKNHRLMARFDNKLTEFSSDEIDELTLAYAVTIHKSQGSEFQIVVIPATMQHYIMLQRNLYYTAITRAKKICVIVGDPNALRLAVENQKTTLRNTTLSQRLISRI